MTDNTASQFDDVVSTNKNHNYEQSLKWFSDDDRNDFRLTSNKAEMTVSKNSVHEGWYAEKETIDVSNVHSAHVWWNNSKDGYYVASSVKDARS